MDRRTALLVFESLEKAKLYEPHAVGASGFNPPIYDVRLDAVTNRESERDYRVRVTLTDEGEGHNPDALGFVFEEARRLEIKTADVQNAGIELR